MSPQIYLPKDNQKLPDWYGVKITTIDGRIYNLEIAQHRIVDTVWRKDFLRDEAGNPILDPQNNPILIDVYCGVNPEPRFECVTKDDKWLNFPFASITIEFDENFSKIIALREEDIRKKEQENQPRIVVPKMV